MLTALETFTDEIAIRIGRLSKRSLVALFWACSSALLPEYTKWAICVDARTEPILSEALAAAYQFAASGQEPAGETELLGALEASVPPGDSADEADEAVETAAQDCWICADIGIRVLVDSVYNAGAAVEYALEPLLHRTAERLFGVSQVGSGPDEYHQVETIMSQPDVSRAVDFLQWATNFLESRPSPSEDALELIRQRATVLAPGNSANSE